MTSAHQHDDEHAGHDHDEHSGHDHDAHAGHDHDDHAGHDHDDHSGLITMDMTITPTPTLTPPSYGRQAATV